jgi:hypothetical protein
MNDLAKAWLEALESDSYEQGQGALRVGDQYCCLGVACDLGEKQGIVKSEPDGAGGYFYIDAEGDRNGGVLPMGMWQALGLKEANPEFVANDFDPHVLHTARTTHRFALTGLNDALKLTFRQIAFVIRNHPEMFTDYKENPA